MVVHRAGDLYDVAQGGAGMIRDDLGSPDVPARLPVCMGLPRDGDVLGFGGGAAGEGEHDEGPLRSEQRSRVALPETVDVGRQVGIGADRDVGGEVRVVTNPREVMLASEITFGVLGEQSGQASGLRSLGIVDDGEKPSGCPSGMDHGAAGEQSVDERAGSHRDALRGRIGPGRPFAQVARGTGHSLPPARRASPRLGRRSARAAVLGDVCVHVISPASRRSAVGLVGVSGHRSLVPRRADSRAAQANSPQTNSAKCPLL